jgi:peptidoglycan/xylan/chitin deacetylase (PgdA/CDA1 family)
VIVTFDDGYDDNYHNAFPVLRSLDIPATLFVSTGYVGQEKTFWFDLIANILFHVPVGPVSLKGFNMDLRVDADVNSRRLATGRLIAALKRVSNERRLEFLDGFEREHGHVVSDDDAARSRPLAWSHIHEMSAAGVEFGSHTVTHPILSRLDDDALERELVQSRDTLERELGRTISILAYPVGGPGEFNEKVVEVARAVGYRLGVSYVPGVNRLDRLDRFRLRRQHVERYTTDEYFSGLLSWPEVFR